MNNSSNKDTPRVVSTASNELPIVDENPEGWVECEDGVWQLGPTGIRTLMELNQQTGEIIDHELHRFFDSSR